MQGCKYNSNDLPDMLKPSEIIDHCPDIAAHFTARYLGYAFLIGVVDGKRTSQYVLISVKSVRALLAFRQGKAA